ncbi:uncharacterized protein LOC106473788, partial [Limulus polyphemus]|uniref:Uncharacterized protein LOC106473788 n=1 Tax=Limulus polyphemus TaxID=6850 RepID=A0ABM1BWB6_LIMPO
MKKNNDRKQNGKIKRNRREAISGVVFDTKSCKRMANLNAQAILSASYCQERWRREKLEKKVCPAVDIQYEISHVQEERLEAFSVRASVTESTKEHEMRVTTCNTQLVVTPQQKDESVRNEKTLSKTRDKKYKTKPVKTWTAPKSHVKVGRRKKNSLDVQSPVPPEMIPISCEVQTISSTSESSRTIASSGLENVGMAQYTEVTKVQINRTKEMEIKEEMRSQKKTERFVANDDVAITRMYHYQTKATSQSYRLQMETTYQPLSTREYSTPATTVRQHQKPKRHVSSAGHVVRPVMSDNQNFYNYSNHNAMGPVSNHQSFMNPNLNGMNNVAMVGMGPISTNYGSAFSVPHFGHSPSMPYTPDEYGGYYQPAGSAVQPILDPCLVHKPVPYHPPQHHHHHPPPPPPSQPHNHYGSGDQCISRHALSSTPSCPMESIPQPHYPQEAMNPNSSSHCFTQDMPHSSPPLAYYPHDMTHSTNPPPPSPYSQENIPQSNASRGFSQDTLPLNNHQFLQNEIQNTPRPHYTQDPMAPHNLPSHGFRQDCMPTNLPHHQYSQDISNCNQAPRPYLSPPNVLSPSNLANPCYSQENSPVRPPQHLNNQPPSCPPLPQKSSSAHSHFHGSIHGPNFHCQSHTASIQQHPHTQPQNTIYPKHQASSIPRDYSPGPTYHELTPVITSRQKDIKTRTPRPAPSEGSFPPVPKAEATQRQHQPHLPINQNIGNCNKSQFPRSETNNTVVIRGQTDRRLQPCNSSGTVLNGRINSISGKGPPVFEPRKPNGHSCSTTNENNNTSSSRTPHHGNQNIPDQSLDSQKAQDLKIKRRMKKSTGLNENTNSSDSKTHSNSFQNGNSSFQEQKLPNTNKVKTKLKQPKISQNNKQKSVSVEKQGKTKIKLPNNSSKILEMNGILSPFKQELPKKNGKKKYSNGWSWEGEPFEKLVLLNNDDPLRLIKCFPAMRHVEGDVIRVRDCVLLKSGPKKTDLPFVAKIVALWENPEDGEMMMSLMWYYRPEHTEQGRTAQDMEDEIFASKHRDVNSVACIEDKCYVLTFTEYC